MPVEADMMLAAAVSRSGTLSILDAGWQVRAAEAEGPVAIAIVLRFPRRQAGVHDIRLELTDYDGNLVAVDPPDGPGPMVIEDRIAIIGRTDRALRTPLLASSMTANGWSALVCHGSGS